VTLYLYTVTCLCSSLWTSRHDKGNFRQSSSSSPSPLPPVAAATATTTVLSLVHTGRLTVVAKKHTIVAVFASVDEALVVVVEVVIIIIIFIINEKINVAFSPKLQGHVTRS